MSIRSTLEAAWDGYVRFYTEALDVSEQLVRKSVAQGTNVYAASLTIQKEALQTVDGWLRKRTAPDAAHLAAGQGA
jgi:hypothetical protein